MPATIEGDKAQRIIEAMRRSVAQRGTTGSTFDRVAREAGVSRGLLHYYFGTKERLLVEAVRRDCELRMELLERQLAGARTAEDFIALMAQNLQETVREDPDFVTLMFELFTLARRNEEIAVEYAELMRRTRDAGRGHARQRATRGHRAAARRAGRGRGDSVRARRRFRFADADRARAGLRGDRRGRDRLRARVVGRLTALIIRLYAHL